MANEVTVTSSLQVRSGNLSYRSQPQQFRADLVLATGPAPGSFLATYDGVDVDLSQLATPSFYRIQNLDATNYVDVGIYDPVNSIFHPLHEVGPGETYVGKLSRNLGQMFTTPGTGTSGTSGALHVKAQTVDCTIIVEAFDGTS